MIAQSSNNERWAAPWLVYLGYGILAISVLAIVSFNVIRPVTVLPRISLAPGYAFAGQHGKTVSSEQGRGQITLYSFSYGGCQPPGCSQSLATIGSLQQQLHTQLPAETQAVMRYVTLSLDSIHDQPTRWAAAAQQYPALVQNWLQAVGDDAQTRQVAGNGFGVYYRQRDGQIIFESRYVLVDATNMIRAYYLSDSPDLATVLRDVALLRQEMSKATGAWRLAYEAAHLFACYPK